METLKLDNQVAVPLARLEPPTAAAAVGPPPVGPPLLMDAALRRGRLLLRYGVADEEETKPQARLYSSRCTPSPDCRVYHGDVDT